MPQDGLAQVLRRLKPTRHPDLLVGIDTCDDAGVFRIAPDLALVQTTDFFPPLVDDPYAFGQIAAANALSDIYAMGGQPLTALNLVGWPDKELGYDWLVEILRGGADKVAEAGAVIVGGHSVRDSEIKYGLAVTGRVHPDRVLTNSGAKPGDVLVLTKPIGSGVITSAAKRGLASAEETQAAIDVMATLNRPGRDAALSACASACTDVTGFGLIGHSFEMAAASGVEIHIDAAAVPLLPGTLEHARAGCITRTHKSTRVHIGDRLIVGADVDTNLCDVLLDAQTSGGLLIALTASKVVEALKVLRSAGADGALVGRVARAELPRVRLD